MSRGVSFTQRERAVLSAVMRGAWARKKGRSVPERRMRFNPKKDYSHEKGGVMRLIAEGIPLRQAAAVHKVPVAVVRRWVKERYGKS